MAQRGRPATGQETVTLATRVPREVALRFDDYVKQLQTNLPYGKITKSDAMALLIREALARELAPGGVANNDPETLKVHVVNMRVAGETWADISRKLKVSVKTVQRWYGQMTTKGDE